MVGFITTMGMCQLQVSTYQEHHQRLNNEGICHLPLEPEPHAAAAADLQQPLREFRVERGTLCSRESGGTGLYTVGYFQEQIL